MTAKPTPNPLLHATGSAWDRIIASVNPPAMLVAIAGMMGDKVRRLVDAEDVWQETLLHAWRDRHAFEWRGLAAFRRWLLEIARNRVRDLGDHVLRLKRGGGAEERFADRDSASGAAPEDRYAGPCARTTPARAAADRELARALQDAIDAVPAEWRDVVRLRLFEDRPFEDIARQLGLGVEGVRYRFRHGAEAYRQELRRRRALDSGTSAGHSPR